MGFQPFQPMSEVDAPFLYFQRQVFPFRGGIGCPFITGKLYFRVSLKQGCLQGDLTPYIRIF